jgi:outer membrane protein TolC
MKSLAAVTALLLLFLPGSTFALDEAEAPSEKDELLAKAIRELTLDEFLDQVDRNYPKIMGAEIERQIAAAKALSKAGAFDPTLALKREKLEYVSSTNSGEFEKDKTDFALDVPTRSGIKWFVGARESETVELGKKPKDFDKYYVGLKVPLLRDWRMNAKLAAERQARLGIPLAAAERRRVRLEILEGAGAAYWAWVAACQQRKVASEMKGLAETRLAAVREQVDRGDKPELSAVEAGREMQKRRGQLAKAERNVQKAALKLSLYLWDDDGQPDDAPETERAPASFPPVLSVQPFQVRAAELRAVAKRPELERVEIERRIVDIDYRLARNDGRPNVDLFLNPGRSSALDVFEPLERQLRAGFKVSVPLRTRDANGRVQAARLKDRKLEMMRQLVEQQVRVEVRDAASRIWTDTERLEAVAAEVSLAKRLEQGERENFRLGGGTLFLVNSRERYRAEAELKQIEVAADYHMARLAYRAATADL